MYKNITGVTLNKRNIDIFAKKSSMALGKTKYCFNTYKSNCKGRHRVYVEDDKCTDGKDDKSMMITITHCNDDEFTCSMGSCVSMDLRCNRITDCPDLSDEINCRMTHVDESYIGDYEPVTVDENYDIVKVSVSVSVIILDILELSEIDGLFDVSFELFMSWFDPRIVMTNLKPEKNLNKITTDEKNIIWKPVIVFDNTKFKEITQTDDRTLGIINKFGNFTRSPRAEAVEAYYFKGEENPIAFSRIYATPFICKFDMAWYPFDIQLCTMDLKSDGNTGEYIDLLKQSFEYKGSKDLSVYFVKDSRFLEVEFDGIKSLKGRIKFIKGTFINVTKS